MRVLWVVNKMLPRIGEKLNIATGNKEGWLSGLSDNLLKKMQEDGAENTNKKNIFKFAVCFPSNDKEYASFRENIDGIECYGFWEDSRIPQFYNKRLEDRFRNIFADFKPDIIHIFGTEYPHSLAACKAFRNPMHTIIGIQGLVSEYAMAYKDGIPEKIVNRFTLRDLLKNDNIELQYEKFVKRGSNERQAIKLCGHIAGRTEWDRVCCEKINKDAEYHVLNETLRSCFYEGEWKYDDCCRHTIFVSQADYPIKGFHLLLKALPKVIEQFPDCMVRVSGNCILDCLPSKEGDTYRQTKKNFKKRLLISSYGKYLISLIENNNLAGHISFLGSINADRVKEELLSASLYCMPSLMENSSNALGEAMLLGVPTVCARTGGTPSMIIENSEGILVNPLNSDELADAIIKVFDSYDKPNEPNTAEIRRYAVNARKHALMSHDGEENVKCLINIYESIL